MSSFGWIRRDPSIAISSTIIFILIAIFVLYPVYCSLQLSTSGADFWSFPTYRYVFEKPWLRRSLWNSLLLGITTASISSIIGFIFAFVCVRVQTPAKNMFRFMATLPIISPPFMLTLSMILLFGKSGFITNELLGLENFDIYGFPGLVVVQSISMFPIAYLTISGVLLGIDSSIEDAAANLGAGGWKVFRSVTLPLATPGVIASWLLVFVTSLADFANPMILAGKFDVLSVQAYLQFTGMGNLPLGAALSNLLLIPCITAYLFQRYYVGRKSYVSITGKPKLYHREMASTSVKCLLVFFISLISLFIILLYVTVLAGCFTKSWGIDYRFSLENFAYVWDVGWESIRSTVLISSIATPIAGTAGVFIAFLLVRKKFPGKLALEIACLLPFALPGTTFGIGYALAFNQPPLLLTGTASIIILSFIFRHMPAGMEAAKASLQQIDPAIDEAARNLGASPVRSFKDVTLPLIKPAWFTGMAYVFVHCMTAVSAVIFLVSAKWNHMTVLILAQTEILRFSAASILCLILILIVLAAFAIIKLLLGKSPITSS
ncbi:MAG: ABC transporter permease [Deltaproteobacteria bacterium CG11_big_fil_rev_8_21_14_0_20_45_16]|nr:MAG: ABC transporter permease [Deltaproteobacteria bacterium CG11_big_fil_rev_8_21_14_0_20_45_16]